MFKHDQKRIRRLHRILNGTTNPPDTLIERRKRQIEINREMMKPILEDWNKVSLTWYQKLIQWLQKLTKKFSK